MAAAVVNRVVRLLQERDGRLAPPRASTDREPLPGGEVRDLNVLIESLSVEGFDRTVATHLVHTFGGEAAAVARLAQSDPGLAEPVIEGHTTIWAELLHAMRREMALTLTDLLIRRTHLFYVAPDQVLDAIDRIAQFAAGEMGWDGERRDAEISAYHQEVSRSLAFREEPGAAAT
jgi:glycerol-3-phosphate dehydrogenase